MFKENGSISQEDRNAIKNWRKEGNHFGLVTGRDITLCEKLLNNNALEADCLLTCNGAISYWNGKMVDKTIIELNRSKEMFRELLAFAPTLVPFTAKDGLTYFPNSYYEDWKELKEKLNYLNAITDVDVFDFLDTLEEGISKISVYTRTEKDCLKYFPIVCDLLKDADVSMTSPVYIEITIKGSNKSSAVQAIFNVTGYDKSNTIYIGDGQNDIPIFDFLEKTYVMSNAKSYVKEHAKTVVDSVKMAIELEEESYNG